MIFNGQRTHDEGLAEQAESDSEHDARAAHLEARDLAALLRVLDWLSKDEGGRVMRVDYHEGEVRVYLEQRPKRGETEDDAYVGESSDFAGAIDDAESDGWRDGL